MIENRDAYARLPFRSDRARRASATGGGLAFLDLADPDASLDTVAGHLREVPLDLIGRPRWVLVRWGSHAQGWHTADEAANALQERLRNVGSEAQAGVIVFEIGCAPVIVWSAASAGSRSHDHVLLARARTIEVRAFLDWGNALWTPNGYHYMLPSGRHTRSFVRVADAFQDLRAAAALSTWLYGAIDNEAPTTLILDVGTLMPIIVELEAAAERHRADAPDSSAEVGPVVALDRYPSNALGLQRNLFRVSPDNPVLGLVSVTDSGGFAERLLSACAALGVPRVRIEQLVSRQLPASTRVHGMTAFAEGPAGSEAHPEERPLAALAVAAPSRTIEDPWFSLGDYDESGFANDDCPLCQASSTARLVRINPRAMSAMVLPEPDLVVPDIFDARRNATLWEAYNAAGRPHDGTSLLGPTGTRPDSESGRVTHESVFFEPARLLTQDASGLIGDRLAEFNSYPKRSGEDPARARVQDALKLVAIGASVVIYEQQERDLLSDGEWHGLRDALVEHGFVAEGATWCDYSIDGGLEASTDLEEANTSGVLVIAFGTRTGLSCQRMFLAGRRRWPDASFRGLIIHAHPEDARVWTSIRNTFTDSDGQRRLLALWLTHLPDGSPLADERATYLAAQQRGLDTPELVARLDELEAHARLDNQPLTGTALLGRIAPKLQPHSYLGEELGSSEALCAIGASMQSARIRAMTPGAPSWAQFDLRRILRSYFDGLIHACVLRWCEPQEAWWGPKRDDCKGFLQELEGVDFDFDLLLPELLLACAQGKLPQSALAHLMLVANQRLSTASESLDQRTRDHLRLGVDLGELALEDSLGSPHAP